MLKQVINDMARQGVTQPGARSEARLEVLTPWLEKAETRSPVVEVPLDAGATLIRAWRPEAAAAAAAPPAHPLAADAAMSGVMTVLILMSLELPSTAPVTLT